MSLQILKGKIVLITGGTGSFGRSFAKHILEHSKLEKLIIFSRDELKQSQMQTEINDPRMRYFIGDVRDLPRLLRAFNGVDIVVHAAALKQVPALEFNPYEAVKTNILGSQNIIDAAIDRGVEKVVLVSTDKAAQPANLYGATKLCAEKLFVAGNAYGAGKTNFSVVRYGNVLGSRGSIVEILLKNKNIDTVNITDERMTRFWINLDQAFSIVLFALEHMIGGEIFIPKAPAMKLAELFDIIVPNVRKKVIGMRPGEKLNETLLTQEEARHSRELKDYFVVLPEFPNEETREKLNKYIKEGRELDQNFSFASNMAPTLSREELVRMIQKIDNEINKK